MLWFQKKLEVAPFVEQQAKGWQPVV